MDRSSTHCKNKLLTRLADDHLYHLGLNTKSLDFKKEFGDVKYVLVAGSEKRIEKMAESIAREFHVKCALRNLAEKGGRYVMYKVGSVLLANHGMGCPSISILLHELIKLVHYADCQNVIFIRLGTSGGLGVPAGSIILTTEPLNTKLEPFYELNVLGKLVKRPTTLCLDLVDELHGIGETLAGIPMVVKGKTVCANDFYEEQARLDGAFCDYTEKEKLTYLERAEEMGAKNFEMESMCFGALCRMAGIKAAVVCTTLLNRLESDQVTHSPEDFGRIEENPLRLILAFLKNRQAFESGAA